MTLSLWAIPDLASTPETCFERRQPELFRRARRSDLNLKPPPDLEPISDETCLYTDEVEIEAGISSRAIGAFAGSFDR